MIGGCRACPTKDSEIAFLRSQVTSLQEQNRELQGKMLDIADPLLAARLAHAQAPMASVNPSPRRLPWRLREDREPEQKPEGMGIRAWVNGNMDLRTNAEVHDSFREEQAG